MLLHDHNTFQSLWLRVKKWELKVSLRKPLYQRNPSRLKNKPHHKATEVWCQASADYVIETTTTTNTTQLHKTQGYVVTTGSQQQPHSDEATQYTREEGSRHPEQRTLH